MTKYGLNRVNENQLTIANEYEIDVSLFANEDVPIEQIAVDELRRMLELHETIESFAKASPESFANTPRISRVAVTPDFHKAQGIPVGTILSLIHI